MRYRPGFSAQCIAESWHSPNGLPSTLMEVLQTNSRFAGVELIDAFLERRTSLRDPWRPSQSDVLAILGLPGELALMTVEGKVKESFGPLVSEWIATDAGGSAIETNDKEPPEPSARTQRLASLKRTLGLDDKETKDLRYQLLHSTPILLTHTPARCRVIPVAGIKLGIGRRLCVASDAEQRTEGVERVEAPVEPKREFVEVGL